LFGVAGAAGADVAAARIGRRHARIFTLEFLLVCVPAVPQGPVPD